MAEELVTKALHSLRLFLTANYQELYTRAKLISLRRLWIVQARVPRQAPSSTCISRFPLILQRKCVGNRQKTTPLGLFHLSFFAALRWFLIFHRLNRRQKEESSNHLGMNRDTNHARNVLFPFQSSLVGLRLRAAATTLSAYAEAGMAPSWECFSLRWYSAATGRYKESSGSSRSVRAMLLCIPPVTTTMTFTS